MAQKFEKLRASDASGQSIEITLTELLKGSGEGEIWQTDQRGQLAKIYHRKEGLARRAEKLDAMLKFPPQDPAAPTSISIAWPSRLLVNSQKQTIGFLMPEIFGAKRATVLYNARLRKADAPGIDWYYLHVAALNVAKVCKAVHGGGYVIGDLKADNWLVDQKMTAVIIDTDSFQVRHPQTKRLYRCLVGTPEYCAPEIFDKDFSTIDRTPAHDNFATAVLIYQFLFSRHPFSGGDYRGKGEWPHETSQRIVKGQWLWKASGDFKPTDNEPSLDMLHPGLVRLMRRAFDDGHLNPTLRPAPNEWEAALNTAIKAMTWCEVEPLHVYGGHQNSCPWCALKVKRNYDAFPSQGGVRSRSFDHAKGQLRQAIRTGDMVTAIEMLDRNLRFARESDLAPIVAEVQKWSDVGPEFSVFREELVKQDDKRDDEILLRLVTKPKLLEFARRYPDLAPKMDRLDTLAKVLEALERAIANSSETKGRYAIAGETAIAEILGANEKLLLTSRIARKRYERRTVEAKRRCRYFTKLTKALADNDETEVTHMMAEYGAVLDTIAEFQPLKPEVEMLTRRYQVIDRFAKLAAKADADDAALCSLWESVPNLCDSPLARRAVSVLANRTPLQRYEISRRRVEVMHRAKTAILVRDARAADRIIEDIEREIVSAYLEAEQKGGSLSGALGKELKERADLARKRITQFDLVRQIAARRVGKDLELLEEWQRVADRDKFVFPEAIRQRLNQSEASSGFLREFQNLVMKPYPEELEIVSFCNTNLSRISPKIVSQTVIDGRSIKQRIDLAKQRVAAFDTIVATLKQIDARPMAALAGEHDVLDAWEEAAELLTPWKRARETIEPRVDLAYARINRTRRLRDAMECDDPAAAVEAWGIDGALDRYEPAQRYRADVESHLRVKRDLDDITEQMLGAADDFQVLEIAKRNERLLTHRLATLQLPELRGLSLSDYVKASSDRCAAIEAVFRSRSERSFKNTLEVARLSALISDPGHPRLQAYRAEIDQALTYARTALALDDALKTGDAAQVYRLWNNEAMSNLPPQLLAAVRTALRSHLVALRAFERSPIGWLQRKGKRATIRWEWSANNADCALLLIGDGFYPAEAQGAGICVVVARPTQLPWRGVEIEFVGRQLHVRALPAVMVGAEWIVGKPLDMKEGKRTAHYRIRISLTGSAELQITADLPADLPELQLVSAADGAILEVIKDVRIGEDCRARVPLSRTLKNLLPGASSNYRVKLADPTHADWLELMQTE